MKLRLTENYKSLQPFEFELPSFAILTGLNGAGKTQILTGISSLKVQIDDGYNVDSIKYMPGTLLSPTEGATIMNSSLNSKVQEIWSRYENVINKEIARNPKAVLTHQFIQKDFDVIQEIAASSKKDILKLDRSDFAEHYPMDDLSERSDIFYHFFSEIFKRYKDKFTDNEFNSYLHNTKGRTDTEFLTADEFTARWGEAPWDFLDKLNFSAGLPYKVHSPIEGNKDLPFELTFRQTETGAEVKFYEMSSGEKAIMSLALALYNTNFEKKFPEILLLDEPDGSLHPSMTKHFLAVLQKFFVEEKGLKVILTTHSPSTVALADEGAIFLVNPVNSSNRIEKTSKDHALKILTEGVPSFSVNYENRRQVFVESPIDVQVYEKIYRLLNSQLISEVSLGFISSGDSRRDKNGIPVANCDQVINITSTLRDFGNKFIWGIIDFDGKNKKSEYVEVLGDGQRYSIENYLFDPLLVAGLLLREKFISREELGLSTDETFSDLKAIDGERLQNIVNIIVNAVKFNVPESGGEASQIKTLDGRSYEVPTWYLMHQGHEFENLVLKTFPKLAGIKKGTEEMLKLAIIDKVLDDIPGLISIDFLNTFLTIQKT